MDTTKQFEQLQTKFSLEKDEAKKAKILEKMRENLTERNGGKDSFTRGAAEFTISAASYQDMVKINGSLSQEESSELLTNISDEERNKQTIRNNIRRTNLTGKTIMRINEIGVCRKSYKE